MTRAVVWFRSDLRIRDNTALHKAMRASSRGVVGLFIIQPEQWREHDWAPVKVDFILRTLRDLSDRLSGLRVPLLVRTAPCFAEAPGLIVELGRELRCDAIYFNREYEFNEARRDEAVAHRCMEAGMSVHACTDQVVFAPGEVMTQQDSFYTVYSPFKRRWRAMLEARGGVEVLPDPKPQDRIDGVEPSDVPDAIGGFASSVDPDAWTAGEEHARRSLGQFVARKIDDYKTDRDHPARPGTSRLSPYLTVGALSPRQCIEAAMEAGGGAQNGSGSRGAAAWCDEIIWREFYKHILVGFPRVSMGEPFKLATRDIEWAEDGELFEAWCEGRTGVPIVDAAMRSLHETGWMHNRLRMITAMFFTKDLFLPWWWGERYFMQNLIDGDLASNNGGWQWSASTGTDAQPYFRIFNPWTQSKRFDGAGEFIKAHLPELGDVDPAALHDPKRLAAAGVVGPGAYPEPVVDHAEARDHALKTFQEIGQAPVKA